MSRFEQRQVPIESEPDDLSSEERKQVNKFLATHAEALAAEPSSITKRDVNDWLKKFPENRRVFLLEKLEEAGSFELDHLV